MDLKRKPFLEANLFPFSKMKMNSPSLWGPVYTDIATSIAEEPIFNPGSQPL
jgi:hypothetical protein